jgi:hypothetical protein
MVLAHKSDERLGFGALIERHLADGCGKNNRRWREWQGLYAEDMNYADAAS